MREVHKCECIKHVIEIVKTYSKTSEITVQPGLKHGYNNNEMVVLSIYYNCLSHVRI